MNHELDGFVGLTTAEALTRLTEQRSEIAALQLVEYEPPPPPDRRAKFNDNERAIDTKATALRGSTGVPYWDNVFATCVRDGASIATFAKAVLLHRPVYEAKRALPRERVLSGGLVAAASSPPAGRRRAVCSELKVPSGYPTAVAHLPMLAFHPAPAPGTRSIVEEICRHLFPMAALILESGSSYHAIGTEVVSQETYLDLLARAILFGPITDRTYLAHQILDRQGSLRLSAISELQGQPRVISVTLPLGST